jgi:hypothetical protein
MVRNIENSQNIVNYYHHKLLSSYMAGLTFQGVSFNFSEVGFQLPCLALPAKKHCASHLLILGSFISFFLLVQFIQIYSVSLITLPGILMRPRKNIT